jgi:hypothetical protein
MMLIKVTIVYVLVRIVIQTDQVFKAMLVCINIKK